MWESDLEQVDISTFSTTDSTRTGGFILHCVEECNTLGLSRTHFFLDPKTRNVLGFIALSSSKLKISKRLGPRGDETANMDEKDHFPLVVIDQIGVTEPRQREGIGKRIISTIIQLTDSKITPLLGCRFIGAWAYDEGGDCEFFSELGFITIPPDWASSGERLRHPHDRERRLILMLFDLRSRYNND